MNFEQALHAISQPIRANALPDSLAHMHQLLELLGNPQQAYPSVVVAGSVGKGTTCHQITSFLDGHLKVGLFTSPHLHSFRERFSINGRRITQTEFTNAVSVIQEAVAQTSNIYSTFEMSTALALWWFRQQTVDIAVLEVGIGGRYDAVNTVDNTLAVITPIELEHAAMLGGTLASIASHKAGIIQPHGYAITAPQSTEVEQVLRHEAAKQQANLQFEPVNQLAITACHNLARRGIIPPLDLATTAPTITFPARMEKITIARQTWLIDGAHTLTSAQRLRTEIDHLAPNKPVRVIIGMLRDKAVHEFISVFDNPQFQIVLTQLPSHRAINAQDIYDTLPQHRAKVKVETDLQAALEQAQSATESMIVVTGSLRTAALSRELLGLLTENEREEALLTRNIFEGADYLSKLR